MTCERLSTEIQNRRWQQKGQISIYANLFSKYTLCESKWKQHIGASQHCISKRGRSRGVEKRNIMIKIKFLTFYEYLSKISQYCQILPKVTEKKMNDGHHQFYNFTSRLDEHMTPLDKNAWHNTDKFWLLYILQH